MRHRRPPAPPAPVEPERIGDLGALHECDWENCDRRGFDRLYDVTIVRSSDLQSVYLQTVDLCATHAHEYATTGHLSLKWDVVLDGRPVPPGWKAPGAQDVSGN